MKNLLLTLLGVFFLGSAMISAEEKAPMPIESKTVHMKIEGMTCSACAKIIAKKLKPLCQAVTIDHKSGKGECTYETAKTDQAAIVKAVVDVGYKVVEVR